LLRPEYLLDHVMQLIPGGLLSKNNINNVNVSKEWKLLKTVCEGLNKCILTLVEDLTNQTTLWTDALELKELFHFYGVNFHYGYISRVYN